MSDTYRYLIPVDVETDDDGAIVRVVVLDTHELQGTDDDAHKALPGLMDEEWPAWQFGY